MKILVVDDSRTMRNVQALILKQLGYDQIEEAGGGLDALSKVGAVRPGLILLDRDMPNMDGLSFLKQFRKADKATPVIMVTDKLERTFVIEAFEAGVKHFLIRPFSPEQLNAKILDALKRRAA